MICINDIEIKNNINMELYNNKNFEDNIVFYKKIYYLYNLVLCKYLDNLYDTSRIDKIIDESNLYIGRITDKQKNIYFKISNLNSEFLFIRNYLHIERLDQKDIDTFFERIKSNNYEVDNTLLEIVERTFKNIITSDNSKTVFYGPSSLVFKFNSNSLVIFINYWKNTKELRGEEFFKINKSQTKLFEELSEEISNYYSNKLNIPVEVGFYKGAINTR